MGQDLTSPDFGMGFAWLTIQSTGHGSVLGKHREQEYLDTPTHDIAADSVMLYYSKCRQLERSGMIDTLTILNKQYSHIEIWTTNSIN